MRNYLVNVIPWLGLNWCNWFKCENVVLACLYRSSVKYQRFQLLHAYCVGHADSNNDCTHTQKTSQGCEFSRSVSSARLTAMQTNTGNLSSQNQEKGLRGVNTLLTWERI